MSRRSVGILLASAAVFLLFAALISVGATKAVDRDFTLWVQSFASPALDRVANLSTILGQSTLGGAAALALSLLLFARGARWAALAPLLIGVTVLIELPGKLLLTHPSPPHEFIRTSFNPLGIHLRTPSSFPSGHVARTVFFAWLLWELVPARPLRFLVLAVATVTPLLRIYLGDHWVSDTIGGVATGTIAGVLAVEWYRRFHRNRRPA
ncbi:MAG: phosphatase PAP2 family protein [Chloroflexi bacterium]|nr:phosphatase PAP2 family protein [Chloroflexota bacterium]